MKNILLTALSCCAALLLTACQTPPTTTQSASSEPLATQPAAQIANRKSQIENLPTIRIKAGSDAPLTDSKGNLWAADSGFDGGASVDRSDTPVTNTDRPELFKSEHHSMNSWTTKLPNGNYTVNLYFAENYSGVTGPDDRLFTITLLDGPPDSTKTLKETKDFSIFKAAGGAAKATTLSTPVTITSGQLSIKFTEQAQHPSINAIEITPQ